MNRIEDSQQLVVQLTCEHCKGRFRLRPKEGRPLRSTVPCPRCHATVAVAWPWMPGSVADPMAEPPQTAVLVKPSAPVVLSPSKEAADPQASPAKSSIKAPPQQQPAVVAAVAASPKASSGGEGQVGAALIQDFRRRVRDAAQLLDAPAPLAPVLSSLSSGGRSPRYAPRPQDVLQQISARYPLPSPSPEARRPRWRAAAAAEPTPQPAAAEPAPLISDLSEALADIPITDRIHATKTSNIAEAAQLDPVLLAMGFAVPAASPSPVGDTLPLSSQPGAEIKIDSDLEDIPLLPDDAIIDHPSAAGIDVDALVNLHPLVDELEQRVDVFDKPTLIGIQSPQAPAAADSGWRPLVVVPPVAAGASAEALPDEDPSSEQPWGNTDHNFFAANDANDLDSDLIAPPASAKRGARNGWLWAASFALVTTAGGYAGWMLNNPPAAVVSSATVSAPDTALEAEAVASGEPSGPDPVQPAAGAASAPLVIPFDPSALSAATEKPVPMPSTSAFPENADAVSTAQTLLAEGRYAEARALLHVARGKSPKDPEIKRLLLRAIAEDKAFAPPTETLKAHADLDSIQRLGGGSTITLKLRHGEELSAFKPLQTRRQSNYRSEIAAWRLCEMIGCSFQIPYNRPIRISRPDFDRLYSKDDKKQREYAANFKDLQWQQEGGESFIYGTQKAWVAHFTKFPIEDTDTWQPWLTIRDRKNTLERTLAVNLRRWLKDEATSGAYRPVLNEAGAATSREVARQLSDMLVFDFLVGNWDRFSTVRAYWGANCQFSSGRLVSIDNGAAFPAFPPGRVEAGLLKVERFSRSLVQGLRDLDRDQAQALLFPDPTGQDAKRFEQFWKQRARVLSRVDALIAKHGEDKVLAFD